MIGKAMIFKKASSSYSQFLQSTRSKREAHYFSDQAEPFVDINFFRRSISLHYQQMYETKKWQNWFYRIAFLGFGLFFSILSILIYFKTANYSCALFFSGCMFVKDYVNGCCFVMAAVAFLVSYFIQPDRDAVHFLMGKVERELTSPLAKHLQFELSAIFQNHSKEFSMLQYAI